MYADWQIMASEGGEGLLVADRHQAAGAALLPSLPSRPLFSMRSGMIYEGDRDND